MRAVRTAAALFLLFTAGCSSGGGSAPAEPPPPLVLWERPAEVLAPPAFAEDLGALGAWTTQYARAAGVPDRTRLGAYGVGNGRVFTQIGTALPLSTWHGSIGPTYNKDDLFGFFSDVRLSVERGGARVTAYDREGIWTLRGAAMVATAAEADGVRVETLDFAPRRPAGAALPEAVERALLRIARVENTGDAPAAFRVILAQTGLGAARRGGVVETREESLRWCGGLAGGEASGGREAVFEAGTLAPGQATTIEMLCAFGADDAAAEAAAGAVRGAGAAALAEATLTWWRSWIGRGARIETPDARVNDLLDGLAVSIGAQIAHTGAVSQMSTYTRAWLRDQAGPVRYFLARGLHEDAARMLAYIHEATVRRGGAGNSYRADLEGPLPPEPDWEALPPATGPAKAEGPSYMPLLHRALLRWTGDASVAAARKGFLRYCLKTQAVSPEGLLPFSGDETYRQAMSFALDVIPETFPVPIEFPYEEEAWSLNSGLLFAAAADAFAELMEAAGDPAYAAETSTLGAKVRARTDAAFPTGEGWWAPYLLRADGSAAAAPFEDVNTQLLWTGYLAPEDPRAAENLAATVGRLADADGLLLSPMGPRWRDLFGAPEGLAVYTGMVPGYGLWNLAAAGHPLAEAAFNALGKAVDPAGNYGEYQFAEGGEHRMLHLYYGDVVSLPWSDYTARYRSWEGGINGEAAWKYLLGAEPDAAGAALALAPRLPNGWPEMRVRGLRVGDARIDLRVTRLGARGTRVEATQTDGAPIELAVALPAASGAAFLDGAPVSAEIRVRPLGERVAEFPATPLGAGQTRVFSVY